MVSVLSVPLVRIFDKKDRRLLKNRKKATGQGKVRSLSDKRLRANREAAAHAQRVN